MIQFGQKETSDSGNCLILGRIDRDRIGSLTFSVKEQVQEL